MTVRQYKQTDEGEWLRMRRALWPDSDPESELADAHQWLARRNAAVLVAEASEALCGFTEVGERAYADGCDTRPVAYLEAWYVDPAYRKTGVGRALVQAAIRWAKQHGYHELASDASLENVESHRAHEALGFQEVERAVMYRKRL